MPGKRIVGIDLVLEHHSALVAHSLQLLEYRGYRQHAFAHGNLAVFLHRVRQIFHVHVVKPRTGILDRLHDIRAGARRVTDIDAQAHARIHAFHGLQHIRRRREVLVFRTMVVNRGLDVVFLD